MRFGLWSRWQRVECILPRKRYIGGIDTATGVQVVAEVRSGDCLQRLLSCRRNVCCVHATTCINIANQHTHLWTDNIATVPGYIQHSMQGDCDVLLVSYA